MKPVGKPNAGNRLMSGEGKRTQPNGQATAPFLDSTRAGAASDLTGMFSLTALTSGGQHSGDDVSRVEQDGFVLLRRSLDEA